METITVYARPTQLPGNPGNHMWLVYTNAAGQSYSLSGWSNTQGTLLSGFGNLDVQVTNWGPKSWDWSARGTAVASQTIKSGADLSSYWSSMTQCAAQIDYANLSYGPMGVNSNSVINTCLIWAGLPQATFDSENPFSSKPWTPGGSWDLDALFDLEKKANPDEPGGPTVQLGFYQNSFGFGGGGGGGEGVFGGATGFGGGYGGAIIGGTSGYWVFTSVTSYDEAGNASTSSGWRWLEVRATRIHPVILDLDRDGLELTSAESSPGFDLFSTGHQKSIGWFRNGDAMLVYDANSNGRVDNATEISFLHFSPAAKSDLKALAAFDSDRDGQLDAGDSFFSRFRLWRDKDFDGISDAGEVSTLSDLGVASIDLAGSGGGYEVAGNKVVGVTSFTRTNGTAGAAYDIAFKAFDRGQATVSQNSMWSIIEVDTNEQVAILRNGSVNISDLAAYEADGRSPTGFQLRNLADTVKTAWWGSHRGFYLDTRGGDDTIDLLSSSHGSVIKAGAGNDMITSSKGDDFILPGSGSYNRVIDHAGNDTFVIEAGGWNTIYDWSGTDVAVMAGFEFGEFEFYLDGSDIVVAALDGTMTASFKGMRSDPASGVEHVMFEDQTITRSELISLAELGGNRQDAPVANPLLLQSAGLGEFGTLMHLV